MTSRRRFCWTLLPATLLAGCTTLQKASKSQAEKTPPKGPINKDAIFAGINQNANKIQSILYNDVDIDGKSDGQIYSLSAKLAYQQQSRFRLTAKALGKSEVDLGSNENEIWFWIARAKPPAVYFCPRSELGRVKLATPFHPDWLLDALAVRPLTPGDYTEEVNKQDYYTLLSTDRSPTGQSVSKRLYIDPRSGRVAAYELFSADNHKLAEARVLDYHEDAASKTYVPKKISIDWPDAHTKLTLIMTPKGIEVNKIDDQFAATLFQRGRFNNTEEVNLAKLDPSMFQDPAVTSSMGNKSTTPPPTVADRPQDPPPKSKGLFDRKVRPAQAAELKGDIITLPSMKIQ